MVTEALKQEERERGRSSLEKRVTTSDNFLEVPWVVCFKESYYDTEVQVRESGGIGPSF